MPRVRSCVHMQRNRYNAPVFQFSIIQNGFLSLNNTLWYLSPRNTVKGCEGRCETWNFIGRVT